MNATLFTLGQAADWIDATLVGDPRIPVSRVHTDTRSLQAGDLFVALRGDRFDGHDFLAQLQPQGVQVAMAETGLSAHGLSGLQVRDTRQALGQLASAWRRQLPVQLTAVTGSNGKTTVTQMIAAIFQDHVGDAALATLGNFNNDIGVPLTLLRLRPGHRLAVLELGMNHPGEIGLLAGWVAPHVALVNNAQREHQEFMHTVEAVAQENGAVLQSLPDDGVAVFPADAEFTPLWMRLAGARRSITFGVGGDVRVLQAQAEAIGWRARVQAGADTLEIELHLPGDHNLRNALAAIACAQAVHVPADCIVRGLASFRPVAGRSSARVLDVGGHRLTLIDDTYNANPDSVRAAIDVLAQLPGPRLLVLGDMGEVGEQGPEFHTEVGHYAREQGIDDLMTHGDLALLAAQAHGAAEHHARMEDLCAAVAQRLPQRACLLVKGSRFMRMERVVRHLEHLNKEQQPC
jgi:UDP-N-acetylmuramoyl-tripeptide--D-alanyl-D-alanine ligase